jgi:hypothetical protein
MLVAHLNFWRATPAEDAGPWWFEILTFGFFAHVNHHERAETEYDEKEAQERFEAALRGALKAPHKPLKAKAAVKKPKAKKKPKK